MKKLHSEVLSNTLTILLIILVSLNVLSVLSTVIYMIDEDAYFDYFSNLDGIVGLFALIMGVIVVIIFLVWIFRVHMDMWSLFPFFSRSPGMALACVMIPIFNFYGIPSVYYRIGKELGSQPRSSKQGTAIQALIAPLVIVYFFSVVTNNYVRKEVDPSVAIILVSVVASTILASMYLALVLTIARGLKNLARPPISQAPDLNGAEDAGSPVGG